MKYKVGDLLVIKDIRHHSHPRHPRHPRLHLHLKNTFGIITEVEEHTDVFEKGSTEDDNGYIWYSQVEQKEYHFYQDEVDCEVIS